MISGLKGRGNKGKDITARLLSSVVFNNRSSNYAVNCVRCSLYLKDAISAGKRGMWGCGRHD